MAEIKDITVNITINGTLDADIISEEVKHHLRREMERVAVAEAKLLENAEAEKWAKIGRKPNEFKEGDFVKYKKCFAEVTRVGIYDMSIEAPNGIIPIAFESAKLIAPVEARFDR
jgi:hypothetical protein